MTQRLFSFHRTYAKKHIVICNDVISIPLDQPFNWLFLNLKLSYKIPKFAENDFRISLRNFVFGEELTYYDDKFSSLYNSLISDDVSTHTLFDLFGTASEDHTAAEFPSPPPTDGEIFGQAYFRIIQSSSCMDLLKLEHSFAVAIETEVIDRNRILSNFKQEVLEQTEKLISDGGPQIADSVSELQRNFHSKYELIKMQLDSRISELKDIQRRNYRSYVMSFDEQMSHLDLQLESDETSITKLPLQIGQKKTNIQNLQKSPSSVNSDSFPSKVLSSSANEVKSLSRCESYMVQLGRQLRTSYNLKLIQADPLNLITTISSGANASYMETDTFAERLSTALTIYSNELTGLIILVDCQMLHSKSQKRLARICERSTDFHFADFDHQLAQIQDIISERIECVVGDTSDANKEEGFLSAKRLSQPGDVYITRHTNLASPIGGVSGGGGGISVVFHVVVSEGANGEKEHNPRCPSPLYTALSAVLRVCFQYNITTLSLPLLLTRRIAEHMDKAWCYRRAETVLKAVKGSLMELSTWRGQVLRCIIFLIPPELPNFYFDSFSHLITSSFQQSNPIIPDTI